MARLHLNAGHPSKQEMIRLFTMHGVITPHVLQCLEHLQCGTCKRTSLPQHPRPAAVPQMSGQFGDRLQADRFWIRELSGRNHCFLGVVDMATNYQQAVRLQSGQCDSSSVLEALRVLWFRPFGYPLILEVDDDRVFHGNFKETLEGYGVHLLIVPAEAHWRIGTIERKNAVLRQIAEKLIDERGCTSGEQLDDLMTAAIQAVNSSVTTKGRTPFQAVFGRLPRFPGDLFGDERALLANYDATYAEEMRSSALRIIAELRASHAIRRALLRKTAPSREESQSILPGSLAAYWRWQKKAKGRKRGGCVLARLLQHDPDGKTAWLHNGNGVVQVTHEQLRPAFGLENWSPTSQDLLVLKDGAQRLQQGLWEDHQKPAPPVDEPPLPEVEMHTPDVLREELVLPLVETAAATPAPAPVTPALPSGALHQPLVVNRPEMGCPLHSILKPHWQSLSVFLDKALESLEGLTWQLSRRKPWPHLKRATIQTSRHCNGYEIQRRDKRRPSRARWNMVHFSLHGTATTWNRSLYRLLAGMVLLR